MFPGELPAPEQVMDWRETLVSEAREYYDCDFYRERASQEDIESWIADVDQAFLRLHEQCAVQHAAELEIEKHCAQRAAKTQERGPKIDPPDEDAEERLFKGLFG
jgi:hypothetical protein